MFKHILSCL